MKNFSRGYSEKLLEFLEKDRFNLVTATIYVFILAAVRSFLEGYIGEYPLYSKTIFTNHVLLSYPEILMGAFFLYLITKINIRKICNVILLGYGILLAPPIIDFGIFGIQGADILNKYSYMETSMLLPTLLNLWNPIYFIKHSTPGMGFMFFSMAVGSCTYVALKTGLPNNIKHFFDGGKERIGLLISILKTIASYFAITLVVWFIGAFQLIISTTEKGVVFFSYFTFSVKTEYYIFFYEYGYTESDIFSGMGLARSLAFLQRSLLLSAFFVILTIMFTFFLLYFQYRKYLVIMLKNLRVLKVLPFTFCSFLGITSLHLVDPDFARGIALDPAHVLHWPYIFFSILIVFLLGQISLLLDDLVRYKDEEKGDDALTRGLIPRYHYRQLTVVTGLSALYFSFLLGWPTLLISLTWIGVSFLTSYIRWQRFIPGYFRFGLFGFLSLLMGYYTPGSWHSKIIRYSEEGEMIQRVNVTVSRMPPITTEIIIISAWVVITFSIFYMFSRLDSNTLSEEKNIYNMMGRKRGLNLGAIFFILLIFPIYLFNSTLHLIFFISIAAGTILWFKILERGEVVLAGLSIILLVFSISFL